MNIELFNEFLMKAFSADDWDKDVFPSVWGRFHNDKNGPKWERAIEDLDPYDLIHAFVTIGMHDEFESMLVMTGTMVRVNEDDENDEETRVRVRVLVHLNGDEPVVAVQPQGEMIFFPDDAGEGMMPDTLREAIEAYKRGELVDD